MKRTIAIAAALILTACAVAPRQDAYSLIDPQGVNMDQYQRDYDQCASLADQTSVGDRAAGGAVIGSVFGALLGGIICGRSCAVAGAQGGALGGVAGGVGGGIREQQNALRACLAGRGYKILR